LTAGKAASQAAHAALDSYLTAPQAARDAYHLPEGGTKIVLTAPNETVLRAAYAAVVDRGLPCALIFEDDGTPLALGIGPCDRSEAKPITRKFSLMK
jgi:peptidyl-tRNA hydrolase